LWAVEDFSASVAALGSSQVENVSGQLRSERASIRHPKLPQPGDMCHGPWHSRGLAAKFIMQTGQAVSFLRDWTRVIPVHPSGSSFGVRGN
jgi:hypothetical protein